MFMIMTMISIVTSLVGNKPAKDILDQSFIFTPGLWNKKCFRVRCFGNRALGAYFSNSRQFTAPDKLITNSFKGKNMSYLQPLCCKKNGNRERNE